jgi:peroxiredoxin
MPSLKQFASEMEPEGVVVVAVSIDESEQEYRTFLNRLQPRFLTSRDAEGELASEFGTFKVPETYVIDRTGRVLQKYVNSQDWMDQAIRKEMRWFLEGVK